MSIRWLPAALVLFCLSPAQAAPLTLTGSVVDEYGAPLAGVTVDVNGAVVVSGTAGAFSASVDSAESPTMQGLLEEAHCFNQSLATSEAQRRMRRFLELGNQTREVELDLPAMYDSLAE